MRAARVVSPMLCLLSLGGAAWAQPAPAAPAAASGAGAAAVKASEPPKPAANGGDEKAEGFTIENSLSIRDPFRRPQLNGGNDSLIPELERYDLDKWNLVGVITGPKKSKAMVVGPNGKLHIVQEETRLGTRHGVITKIVPGAIAVEEKVVNLLGQEESVETVIQFKEKSDETKKE